MMKVASSILACSMFSGYGHQATAPVDQVEMQDAAFPKLAAFLLAMNPAAGTNNRIGRIGAARAQSPSMQWEPGWMQVEKEYMQKQANASSAPATGKDPASKQIEKDYVQKNANASPAPATGKTRGPAWKQMEKDWMKKVGTQSRSQFGKFRNEYRNKNVNPAWSPPATGSAEKTRPERPVIIGQAPKVKTYDHSESEYAPLSGQMLTRVSDGVQVDLGKELGGPGMKLCILGTYPADFNMIEYLQHLMYYLPQLKESGVSKFFCTINGSPASAKLLAELLALPDEIELLSDESGSAGRAFGVGRGWLPDKDELDIRGLKLPISPYVKLFGMLVGLGARDTLPSVITGYIGNPWGTSGWIQAALAQGQRAGRWPDMALDLDDSGKIRTNSFEDLPLVGSWGRRPLELATLRLQTMLGLSLARWSDLQPVDDRCLTQLGGLVLIDGRGQTVYDWRDNGICNVADFEKVREALPAM